MMMVINYDNSEDEDDYDMIDNNEGELMKHLLETWDGLDGTFSVPLRPVQGVFHCFSIILPGSSAFHSE